MLRTKLEHWFGAWRVPEDIAVRVKIDQLTTRARFSSMALPLGAVVALILAWQYWNTPPQPRMRLMFAALQGAYLLAFFAFRIWLTSKQPQQDFHRSFALICISQLLLGGLWAVNLAVMITVATPQQQALLYGLSIALMSAASFMGPIPVAFAFWTPVTIGSLVAVVLQAQGLRINAIIFLSAYAAITSIAITFLNIRLTRQAINAIRIEENNELIRLLLKDFEENASDWLWETDEAFRLRQVSPRFAAVAQRSEEALRVSLMHLVGADGEAAGRASPAALALAEMLIQRQSFRDHVVPVLVGGDRRYWSLSGRPILDQRGAFAGYRGVGSDITAAHIARERVAYLARFDSLTRLHNRVVFNEAIELAFSPEKSRRMALLYLDLDDFKGVNDDYGHATGDSLLAAVGDRIRGSIGDADIAARLGGDEFAILMPDADAADARRVARQIIDSMGRVFRVDGGSIEIGLSIGVALAPHDGASPDELCKAADLALYSAKSTGGGVPHFYDSSTDAQLQIRRSLQGDLKRAINRGELSLVFQPIVEIATRRIVAVEALIRWAHPERGPQYPSSFIPAAEQSGLIVPLGAWVIREACRIAALLPPPIMVAINLSPIQLRGEDLIATVGAALATNKLSAARLEFEITETAELESDERTMSNLTRLHELGCRISLDDFGAGFSSLSYMRGFPFDKLKIDRSFINDLGSDGRTAAVFETIMDLGRRMHITIVAEGVETAEQAEMVRLYGCTQAQGFYFARPLDEPAIMALTRTGATAEAQWAYDPRV